ncbi:MAG: glycosyltransferase [Promethearchaeota archaeon]
MKLISPKNKPKISVVIPVYNEENYIQETLIAVKKQVCDFPYEVIVVDGQSSDNTVSIANKYAKVYISPQKGRVFQLNYGALKSIGDLILFLDGDTIIKPYFLQTLYKKFKKNKNLFACAARFKYYDGKILSFKIGSISCTITQYFFINFLMHSWYFFKTLFGYPELCGCNTIVRRKIYFKVGGFKEPPSGLGADKVFSDSLIYLIRKIKKGKIKTLNLISVLTSGRNLSVKRSAKRIWQYFSMKDIYYELAKKLDD